MGVRVLVSIAPHSGVSVIALAPTLHLLLLRSFRLLSLVLLL
jgi:hypothetical protein